MGKLFANPLSKIIALSLVLAVGFLLVILGGALFKNWSPLISAAIFSVAYLPIIVCRQWSHDDFMSESSILIVDFGKFLSAFLTISGIGISLVLYHSRIINLTALILSLIGGLLIHGTIVAFNSFFNDAEEAELTGFEI